MSGKQKAVPLSPTVMQVLDEFVSVMQADAAIDDQAIARLDELLRVGTVPKPDDIHAALFQSPDGDET